MSGFFEFKDGTTPEEFIKNFNKSFSANNPDGENKADFPWITFLLLFLLFRPEGSRDATYWKGKYDALKEIYTDDRGPKNV